MIPLTLNQKIKIALDLIFSSTFCITLIIFSLLLIVLLLINLRKDNNKKKKLLIIVYTIILTIIILKYYKLIFTFIDYLLEKILTFIYFPNFAIYIIIIICTNISLIISLKKQLFSNFFKWLHIIFFCLFNFLFTIVLEIIYLSDINIYEDIAIYQDVNLLVIVEFSIGIWVIWLSIIIIQFIFNKIKERRKPAIIFEDQILYTL